MLIVNFNCSITALNSIISYIVVSQWQSIVLHIVWGKIEKLITQTKSIIRPNIIVFFFSLVYIYSIYSSAKINML